MTDVEFLERRAKTLGLLGKKVTATFVGSAGVRERRLVLDGFEQHFGKSFPHARLLNTDGTHLLVSVRQIKELFDVNQRNSEQMWEMMDKHLQGVDKAIAAGDTLSAFRIAADAVTCLFECIRLAADERSKE